MPEPTGPSIDARYEILDELGRGGMGVVYKARDRETGELIAVKLLKPEIAADPTSVERFKNELRLARKITHKHVCRIYEFNRADDTAYISMELVQGESLHSVLSRFGTLSFRKGIEIARQICAGLREAHAQGIVHRDLKPQNIMLDTGGNAKIMDFGIAKTVDAGTTTTLIVGTPPYMAPEQAEGKPVDRRADVYALGLILYEIFTGSAAFSGDTPLTVLMRQVREQAVAPRKLEPTIPDWLEQVILKCLEKDPAKRFQSVDELEASLTTPSKTLLPKVGDYIHTRQVRVGILTAVAAAAMILALVAGFFIGRKWSPAPAAMHHRSSVHWVVFDPDGNLLASASEDRTVKIWAVPREREVRTLGGHTGSVNSIAFSPDGRLLASGSSDQTIKLWNTSTWREARTLRGHSAQVYAVAFSQDGKWLASGAGDGTVKVWDATTGDELRSWRAHGESVNVVVVSPEGKLLASAGDDRTIKLWESGTWRELRTLQDTDPVMTIAFAPDGRWLASGGASNMVKLWEVATGQQFHTLAAHRGWVNGVLFSSDGQSLVSGGEDGTIRLWDVTTGIERKVLLDNAGSIEAVALSTRGGRLAWGNAEGDIGLLRPEELK
jgi:serine/threonine protein kinase